MSDDLPAPFSPNSAWTSRAFASNSASSRATNPSNDFLTPTSLRAATITALQGSKAWRRSRAAPRSSFNLLFLRDHAGNVPIHFPQIGVADDLAGGYALLAIAVLDRARIDMQLAVDDLFASGHHLVDDVLRHVGAAAGDIGAAVFDRDEVAVGIGYPVSGLDLLDLADQILVPNPGRRAERRLRGEFAQVAMVPGAVDLALLRHDLHGWRVDVHADDVDTFVGERFGGGAFLDRVVPGAGEHRRQSRLGIEPLRAKLVTVDRPVDDAKGVGADKAEFAGLRHAAGNHAAQKLALIGAPVKRLQVRAVGRARGIEEGDIRMLGGKFLERVGITERSPDDDVVAALDELL